MSGLPDLASLSGWMIGVDRQLRALAAGNPLDRGAVRDPQTGEELSLLALAFGLDAVSNPSALTLTTNDNTWYGGGPDLEVPVETGRLIAFVSAELSCWGNNASFHYGAELSGPVYRPPNRAEALAAYYRGYGMDVRIQGTRAIMWLGLPPGVYTISSKFNLVAGPAETGMWGGSGGRTLIAFPF